MLCSTYFEFLRTCEGIDTYLEYCPMRLSSNQCRSYPWPTSKGRCKRRGGACGWCNGFVRVWSWWAPSACSIHRRKLRWSSSPAISFPVWRSGNIVNDRTVKVSWALSFRKCPVNDRYEMRLLSDHKSVVTESQLTLLSLFISASEYCLCDRFRRRWKIWRVGGWHPKQHIWVQQLMEGVTFSHTLLSLLLSIDWEMYMVDHRDQWHQCG